MPADNIVHSAAALRTTEVWSQTIGYDPHAPVNEPVRWGLAEL